MRRVPTATATVALLTLLTASGALFTEPAHAAFYKCVDARGATSYGQTPCPLSASGERLPGDRERATLDCRIARNFLWQTAQAMHEGDPSHVVFDRYGGIDSVSPSVIAIINYAYTYRGNTDTSPDRVAALGTRRCQAGAFGRVDCSVFPTRFIAELGGCAAALDAAAPNGVTSSPGAPAAARPAPADDHRWLNAPAPGTTPDR